MSLSIGDISTWMGAIANKENKRTPEEILETYDDAIDKKGIFANAQQDPNSLSGVDEEMVGRKLRKWGDPIPQKKEETPMSENVISPDGSIGIPDPNEVEAVSALKNPPEEKIEEIIVSFPDKAKVEALKMRFLKGEFNAKLNPDEKDVIYALIKIFDLDYPV